MVALIPNDPLDLAVEGGLPADELHITLCYLGEADQINFEQRALLEGIVGQLTAGLVAFPLTIWGIAEFHGGTPDACVCALVEGDELADVYDEIEDAAEVLELDGDGYDVWVPHLTLGYGIDPATVEHLQGQTITIGQLVVVFGEERHEYPLLDPTVPDEAQLPAIVAAPSYGQPRDWHGRWVPKGGGGGAAVPVGAGGTAARPGMGDIPVPAFGKYGGSARDNLDPKTGGFTAERQALHDKIVNDTLKGKTPPNGQPEFVVLGGGCASGKSNVIKNGVVKLPDEKHTVMNGADEYKDALPGKYKRGDPEWAAHTHEESVYVSQRINAAAQERHLNVVQDGTGNGKPSHIEGKAATAQKNGYKVRGEYVTIPTETAVARARDRGVRTGRILPDTVVRQSHANVSRSFPTAAKHFDEVHLYDTSSRDVSLIASGGKESGLKIVNPAKYSAFLGKAAETPITSPGSVPASAGLVAAPSYGQPRDWHGRWVPKGGGAGGAAPVGGGGTAVRPGMGDIAVPAFGPGDSASEFIDPKTGGFTKERQALHDKIVNDALKGKTPPDGQPEFVMLGGGTASGKSTVIENGVVKLPDAKHTVTIDSDALKTQIPGKFKPGDKEWASNVHEESSYLAKRVNAAAQERKVNVVLDGTGDSSPSNVEKKIAQAHANGYKARAEYVTVPTETAVSRARARGEKTGRVVPDTVTRGTHVNVSRTFPSVADKFDSVTLYDTSSGAPKLIASGTKGTGLKVHDPAAYGSFLAKGTAGLLASIVSWPATWSDFEQKAMSA